MWNTVQHYSMILKPHSTVVWTYSHTVYAFGLCLILQRHQAMTLNQKCPAMETNVDRMGFETFHHIPISEWYDKIGF